MNSPAPSAADKPLANPKHEAVLQAWIADPGRVWWKAYRSVYPKSSQRAAETAASRLLKRAEFAARKDWLLQQISDQVVSAKVMGLTEVLEELSKLGRSDIRHCIVGGDDTGEVIESIENLKPEHSAAIQELIVETYVEGKGDDAREVKRVKVKLFSKPQALHELRAHFEPLKHEHTGKDGGPIEAAVELTATEAARRIAFLLTQAKRAKAGKKAA